MASGALRDYFGVGLIADRPPAPDLYGATLGLWLATDTGVLSGWDGATWSDLTSPGGGLPGFEPTGGWSNGALLQYSSVQGAFVEIPPGAPGDVLTAESGDTSSFQAPSGAVSSVNGQTGIVELALEDLTDVLQGTGTPEDGDALVWSTILNSWVASPSSGGVASVNGQTGVVSLSLEDLDDVLQGTGTPENGDVLTWDSTLNSWVASPASGGGSGDADAVARRAYMGAY